ncbi:hypothetical protein pb186bvf_015965 [Paramecium bursaria]
MKITQSNILMFDDLLQLQQFLSCKNPDQLQIRMIKGQKQFRGIFYIINFIINVIFICHNSNLSYMFNILLSL